VRQWTPLQCPPTRPSGCLCSTSCPSGPATGTGKRGTPPCERRPTKSGTSLNPHPWREEEALTLEFLWVVPERRSLPAFQRCDTLELWASTAGLPFSASVLSPPWLRPSLLLLDECCGPAQAMKWHLETSGLFPGGKEVDELYLLELGRLLPGVFSLFSP